MTSSVEQNYGASCFVFSNGDGGGGANDGISGFQEREYEAAQLAYERLRDSSICEWDAVKGPLQAYFKECAGRREQVYSLQQEALRVADREREERDTLEREELERERKEHERDEELMIEFYNGEVERERQEELELRKEFFRKCEVRQRQEEQEHREEFFRKREMREELREEFHCVRDVRRSQVESFQERNERKRQVRELRLDFIHKCELERELQEDPPHLDKVWRAVLRKKCPPRKERPPSKEPPPRKEVEIQPECREFQCEAEREKLRRKLRKERILAREAFRSEVLEYELCLADIAREREEREEIRLKREERKRQRAERKLRGVERREALESRRKEIKYDRAFWDYVLSRFNVN